MADEETRESAEVREANKDKVEAAKDGQPDLELREDEDLHPKRHYRRPFVDLAPDAQAERRNLK